jgi:hypothetical protein
MRSVGARRRGQFRYGSPSSGLDWMTLVAIPLSTSRSGKSLSAVTASPIDTYSKPLGLVVDFVRAHEHFILYGV